MEILFVTSNKIDTIFICSKDMWSLKPTKYYYTFIIYQFKGLYSQFFVAFYSIVKLLKCFL